MVNSLMQQLSNKFKDKKILVVGLGLQEGGVGLARFFCELGANVTVTDLKSAEELTVSIGRLNDLNINYSLGGHKIEDFLNADVIFKGPSVPWNLKELVEAENKGIPIEMEIAFTAFHLKSKLIGVTGTRGKTTTTEMIFALLKNTGQKVLKAGNISGISTINILKEAREEDIVLFELSSWSLSGFHKKKISPNIAVFTNFYPDHLNYYRNMDDYFFDKKAIYAYQKENDICFINKQLKHKINEEEIKSKLIYYDKADFQGDFKYLKGDHNRENAAAALLVAKKLGITEENINAKLKYFKPAKYRQEVIKTIDKVTIVNDSTSTTPISTIKAIRAFNEKPIVLILGGHSKNLAVNQLTSQLANVKFVVVIRGSLTNEIYHAIKIKYKGKISEKFDDLKKATDFAFLKAKELKKECYLLFSPGATSFAMFKNEFDRGDKFNEYVSRL